MFQVSEEEMKLSRFQFEPQARTRTEAAGAALRARVRLQIDDIKVSPSFFDFVYRLVADFEGHQEAATDSRYFVRPQAWVSSFGEMYSTIAGRMIEDLACHRAILNLGWTNDLT